ncbi:MAG: signal peptide peptidase SppA, partial [Acidobacteria bacterium]|nr:signal peptide peptidase SppA [Acidobacteriota bacterium]
ARLRPHPLGCCRPPRRPRVALLYATGVIASGRSGYDPVNGPVAGSQSLVEQIRRIRDDESIRAVILRIDSPGGSSVASDVVWRELQVLRERWPDRPIIASMSDLAASGGYYIALPAHAIVAQPGTLTGSIGIYAGKFTVGGALEKLGIGTGTLTAGANADIYSPFTPFTPDQRARLDASLQAFYDGFVQRVADSRGTTVERIRDLARGRVWTGAQARANGLVDELGGMDVAVRLAKARAGIGADEDVELVVFAPRRTFYEALLERIGGTAGEGALLRALGGDVAAGVRAVSAAARFRRGEPLALMPFAFFH